MNTPSEVFYLAMWPLWVDETALYVEVIAFVHPCLWIYCLCTRTVRFAVVGSRCQAQGFLYTFRLMFYKNLVG